MKAFRVVAVLFLASMLTLSIGCGGGGGDDGGGGGGGLAKGTFVKEAYTQSLSSWGGIISSAVTDIKMQFLYTATSSTTQLSGSGYITRIEFQASPQVTTAVTCPDVTINMGHTSVEPLTTTFANNIEQGKGSLVTVLQNKQITIPVGAAGDHFAIDLATPFYYNGTDNLVVEFIRAGACTASVNLRYDLADGYTIYSTNLASATGILENPPTTRFTFSGGEDTLEYGGTTNNTWPLSTSLPRLQQLYLASEIDGSGPITGMAFQVNGSTAAPASYTMTVKMGHTSNTTLSMTWADNYDGTVSTVASDMSFTIPAGLSAGEYFWIPLTGSFTYDGVRNLVVEVDVSAASASTGLRSTNIVGRRTPGYHSDGAVATGSGQDYLENIKIRFNGGPMSVQTDGLNGWIVPFGNFSENKTQFLYENWSLGTGGKITAVSFRLVTGWVPNVFDHTDVHCVMGHTSLSALGTGSFSANIESNMTTVFNGTVAVTSAMKQGDWVEVPLSTPFTYNSTKNIVVQCDTPAYATTNYIMGNSYAKYPTHLVANTSSRSSDVPSTSAGGIADIRFTLSK